MLMNSTSPRRRNQTLVVVNSLGRQASSVIRVASAVGFTVRAQLRSCARNPQLSNELASLNDVTLIEGSLEDPKFISDLFAGANIAFINTTSWGDEVAIGKSLASAAKKGGTHPRRAGEPPLEGLPCWKTKFEVEKHVREVFGLDATFVYAGCYNNNFSSVLPVPLWQLEEDGDGPAILQVLKDGVRKWGGMRIPLAFEVLTPLQAAAAFTKGLGRRVVYVQSPLDLSGMPIPQGYQDQLYAIAKMFQDPRNSYFLPGMGERCPDVARNLWQGWRSLEEYAREVFPVEERANGAPWILQLDAEEATIGESMPVTPNNEPNGMEMEM
ncbi:hypothetical protein BDZ91DRAFT_768929 [Kalaharituber pfeilii]|nr:hypothetical protein BDZ91DRAFT_768929 [Kalaharituber pfeilii]